MASENFWRPVLSLVVMNRLPFGLDWSSRNGSSDLSNVSRACKVGYSRQQFYEIRRNFQTYGAEGLIDRLPGTRGPHPNRVSAEIEQAVLEVGGPIDSQGATCRDRTTQARIRTARTGNVLPPKSNSARLAVASGCAICVFAVKIILRRQYFLGMGSWSTVKRCRLQGCTGIR